MTSYSISEISEAIQEKCLAFNNAEACNGISKADFKSKSFNALKEARESLYWIDLLHRNGYLDDKQHSCIYADCAELVKVLTHRCKKLDGVE